MLTFSPLPAEDCIFLETYTWTFPALIRSWMSRDHAAGGAGMAPIWIIIPRKSATDHRSTHRCAPKRRIVMPGIEKDRPLGGMPWNVPVWVPENRKRHVSTPPSTYMASVSTWQIGRAHV